MEIGVQIKQLRLRRGITQDAMAQHLGVTPQAVSKWERGAATPDISLLPGISAYFGVTIDELFAVSDDTRMERIQNMLWDVRYLSETDASAAKDFLLKKAQREPENGKPMAMLAEMENHIAKWHHDQAAEYAKEALKRDHTLKDAHSDLVEAMNGCCGDWCAYNNYELIEYYKEFVSQHPDYVPGYLWLMDQLLADRRLDEAAAYLAQMKENDSTFRTPLYLAQLELCRGNTENAMQILKKMEQDHPDQWMMYLGLGDMMIKVGRFEDSKRYYRVYLDHQKPPRYTDSLTSIAQLCEILGDYNGAMDAIREEIEVLATDWDTTSGESVDQLTRKLNRLEKKLK